MPSYASHELQVAAKRRGARAVPRVDVLAQEGDAVHHAVLPVDEEVAHEERDHHHNEDEVEMMVTRSTPSKPSSSASSHATTRYRLYSIYSCVFRIDISSYIYNKHP